MNGSYAPELTELLKEIIEEIAKNIIKEGQPIILIDEYSWYREVLSLMAKQVNLCDSCMLLLENGMEQEAYLLARSQFNNSLWIKYLCEADEGDDTKLKEFFYQPNIAQLRTNKNLIKMITEYGDALDDEFKADEIIDKLNESSEENRKILRRENITEKQKSIAELAKQNVSLFGMYITLYNEGSKFEHSDISTTKLYRKKVVEGYPEEQVFVFDLGKSNKEGWFKVFKCSLMSMFFAFESIYSRISNREKQLFEATVYGKGAYSKEDFTNVIIKLKKCISLLEDYENE